MSDTAPSNGLHLGLDDLGVHFAFVEGDTELNPLPSHLFNDMVANCQRFKTIQPSCARPPLSATKEFCKADFKLTPYVVPGDKKTLLSARYLCGNSQIVVVQQNPKHLRPIFNAGRAAIIVNPQKVKWNGTRMIWYVWDPTREKYDYDENCLHVEKMTSRDRDAPDRPDSVGDVTPARTAAAFGIKLDSSQKTPISNGNGARYGLVDVLKTARAKDQGASKARRRKRTKLKKTKTVSKAEKTSALPKHETLTKPTASLSVQKALQLPSAPPLAQSISHTASQLLSTTESGSALYLHGTQNEGAIVAETDVVTNSNVLPTPPATPQEPTPSGQSELQQMDVTPSPAERGRRFVFTKSHNDVSPKRVPITEVNTNRKLFNFAICYGIIKPHEDLLQLDFQGEQTYVMSKHDSFFNEFMERVSLLGSRAVVEIVVSKADRD